MDEKERLNMYSEREDRKNVLFRSYTRTDRTGISASSSMSKKSIPVTTPDSTRTLIVRNVSDFNNSTFTVEQTKSVTLKTQPGFGGRMVACFDMGYFVVP